MSKCKFKIGDKVRIVKNIWSDNAHHSSVGVGEVHTIINCYPCARYPYRLDKYFGYSWCDEELELVTENKIVITTDGTKITTATLYEDGKKVKTATAKCCPEDTFDFMIGAKLACERLSPKKEETEWRVVNRTVRDGDYIRITRPTFSFDNHGDILRVSFVRKDGMAVIYAKDHPNETNHTGNFEWYYCGDEYEVVEKVTKTEEPHKPKYYNGKVVCIKKGFWMSTPVSEFTIGKIYNVVDGVITSDNGYKSSGYTEVSDSYVVNNLCARMGWTFIPLVED